MIEVIISVIVISLSGALSPGPLTTTAILEGLWGGRKNGFYMAIGHTVVEFPYVVALVLIVESIKSFLETPIIKNTMIIISSIFIFYFGYLSIKDGLESSNTKTIDNENKIFKSPFLAGIILTGFNPYFLLWWITVGLPIITLILPYGVLGIIIVYISHVWLDYAWLTFVAGLGEYGSKILGSWKYRGLLVAIGAILIIFGIALLLSIIGIKII